MPQQGTQAFTDQTNGDVESTQLGKTAQFLAGLAGLVAVPVVAWSEYTLQRTGKQAELCSCKMTTVMLGLMRVPGVSNL